MDNKEQRVIIDKNGSLRVESNNGLYAGGLHSCVIAGDFIMVTMWLVYLINAFYGYYNWTKIAKEG